MNKTTKRTTQRREQIQVDMSYARRASLRYGPNRKRLGEKKARAEIEAQTQNREIEIETDVYAVKRIAETGANFT